MSVGFSTFAGLNDDQWIETLVQSVSTPVIDGIQFATFPDPDLQATIVGSSNEAALREAGNFYKFVKSHHLSQSKLALTDCRVLDFGVGWGRIARFFARDVLPGQVYGVDVMPLMIDVCRRTMVPAALSVIDSRGSTPFRDGLFDIAYAYSVFTHLPEQLALHWLTELHRTLRPGGLLVMTVEPPRFITFCRSIAITPSMSMWHQYLSDAVSKIPDAEDRVARGELVYIPTGGGPALPADVYGDTVIPSDLHSKELVTSIRTRRVRR